MAELIGIGDLSDSADGDLRLTFRAGDELKSSILALAKLYGIPVVEQNGISDRFEDLEADDRLPPDIVAIVGLLLREIQLDLGVG